jgi:hypothetical protein
LPLKARDSSSMDFLIDHPVTHRIAFGPNQSEKTFILRTIPAHTKERNDHGQEISGRLFTPLRRRIRRASMNQDGAGVDSRGRTAGLDRTSSLLSGNSRGRSTESAGYNGNLSRRLIFKCRCVHRFYGEGCLGPRFRQMPRAMETHQEGQFRVTAMTAQCRHAGQAHCAAETLLPGFESPGHELHNRLRGIRSQAGRECTSNCCKTRRVSTRLSAFSACPVT